MTPNYKQIEDQDTVNFILRKLKSIETELKYKHNGPGPKIAIAERSLWGLIHDLKKR